MIPVPLIAAVAGRVLAGTAARAVAGKAVQMGATEAIASRAGAMAGRATIATGNYAAERLAQRRAEARGMH